jgi:hypothetical protein
MRKDYLLMNQEEALPIADNTRGNVRAILNNPDKEKQLEAIDLLIRMAVMKAYKDGFDSCYEQMEKIKI